MQYLNTVGRFKFFTFMLVLLGSTPLEARFATQKDAASEIQFFNRNIEVKEDGTLEEEIELKVKVLKELGTANLATQPLYYDQATQKLKITTAKSTDQGVNYSVDSDYIEDQPAFSQDESLSNYRQVLIAFPHLHTGTELYLKYQLNQKVPLLAGTLFADFIYGREGYWKTSKVKLSSAIPFSVVFNDPENFLDVQSGRDGKLQTLEISQRKPFIKQVLDEQDAALDNKAFPWVSISSLSDWKALIAKVTPEYERILAQPLPELLDKVASQAAFGTDVFNKIDRATSLLAHELRYLGDWRNSAGSVFPNSLETIAKNRKGDCKDIAVATVAVLRKLGIRANVAWVRRGGYQEYPNNIPSTHLFNHAIVRIESLNQLLWVDPTNFASFSHGLFPDISDRWALPLMVNARERVRIPRIQPESSQLNIVEKVTLLKDRALVTGTVAESGAAAIQVTGASLRAPKEGVSGFLLRSLIDVNQAKRWSVKYDSLDSRIVQDFQFYYEYEKRAHPLLKTSRGPAHLIQNPALISKYLSPTQERVSDLVLADLPNSLTRTTVLSNVKWVGQADFNCKLDSPWLSASRQVSNTKSGVEVVEKITVKSAWIPNVELKTREFSQLQNQLEDCFIPAAILFK
jgi:transglutaminase-like putative cysteine protease